MRTTHHRDRNEIHGNFSMPMTFTKSRIDPRLSSVFQKYLAQNIGKANCNQTLTSISKRAVQILARACEAHGAGSFQSARGLLWSVTFERFQAKLQGGQLVLEVEVELSRVLSDYLRENEISGLDGIPSDYSMLFTMNDSVKGHPFHHKPISRR
jgi:hypothetical protein